MSPRMALTVPCVALCILAACTQSVPGLKALAAVKSRGGKIARDERRPGCAVVALDFQFKKLNDTDIALLRPFVDLERLELVGAGFNGTGLVHLNALKHLRHLGLSNNPLTDDSLAALRGLQRLETLNLQLTPLTDAGLPHLRELGRLRELLLSGTSVTDAGLAWIKDLVELRVLGLDETAVTDAGLDHLRSLTKLEAIRLPSTTTDTGLSALRGMMQLRELDLRGSQVTDAGLARLGGLPGLRFVDLREAPVTARGVRDLERALPQLEVDYEPVARVGTEPTDAAKTALAVTESAVPAGNSGSPPGVREVLGWLSPRTETIVVARGPFTVEEPADGKDEEMTLLKTLRGLAMGPLSVREGAYLQLLAGQTVSLAVEGSRRFRHPRGLGMGPYDGCHILVFREELGSLASSLRKALAEGAVRTTRMAGEVVYVFEEKHENDWWTSYLALPQPNVLLGARDEASLEEVLERRRLRAAPRFLGNRFEGWERLSEQAPVWAMRHYTPAHHEGLTRVSFKFDPIRRCATFSLLSPYREVLDELASQGASAHATRTIVVRRRPSSGALEIEYTFADEESLFEFLLTLLGMLGHGVAV